MLQEHSLRVIKRLSEPTKLDTADFLTLCEVGMPHQKYEEHGWYIQVNTDCEHPRWEFIGTLANENILLNLISFLKK